MKRADLTKFNARWNGVLAAVMLALVQPGIVLAQAESDAAATPAESAAPVAAPTAEQKENALRNVDVTTLSGNRVQLKFTMEQNAAEPLSFTIDNPARIAFDFAKTKNVLAQRNTNIGVGVARSLSAVEANGRTRVVLNLVRLVPYETRVEGKDVYVILSSGEQVATSMLPKAETAPATMVSSQGAAAGHSIKNIDFRRGEKGEGRIIITLSDPSTNVNIHQEGGKVAVDFMDATLPDALAQRLDVTDFATPVTDIETTRMGGGVRMLISAKGPYEHLAFQSDDLLTIEVKKTDDKDKAVVAGGPKKTYTGERLSLNFQSIEVRAVLQLIADFTNMNLVTSDTVKGSLTLRLQNVPWDQALDIILKTKGLDMRKTDNVVYVGPADEIAAREKQDLEARRQIQELEPLYSEMVQVNYARASDIATLLKADKNSVLSSRGSVTIDSRTNTLLVQDTADKLVQVRKLVTTLDIPVKQVLIESRIVIANSDFGKDLGARFGISRDSAGDAIGASSSGNVGVTSGTIGATTQLLNNETLTSPGRLNVNLPVAAPAGSIAFGLAKLPMGTLVDLELSAMQTEGKGEVISTPRVITSNQKEALIEQGVEIPYQEASSSGATSVSFKKATLSLRVTPQITPDDRVIMDLKVNKDSVGTVYNGVPSINTREVNTQVLVQNGETVVLGGVYEQSKNDGVTKVPFFGDLPLVGALFRSTTKTDNKEELLIFITPKIVKDGAAIQ